MPKINEIFGSIDREIRRSRARRKKKTKVENDAKNQESEEATNDLDGENESLPDDLGVEEETLEATSNDYENDNENNKEEFISASSVSMDGIMKTAPEYPEQEYEETKIEEVKTELEQLPSVIESEAWNVRYLNQYAKTYKLETFDKNFLLIFNQENIVNYEPRTGTEKDVEALKTTLSKYNFECYDYHDLTKAEIMEQLKIFESKDFTDYGCVAVAVLTHGNKNGLIRAKDREYSEIEIINFFKTHNKPTLVTKPKLLIIQACRGLQLTPAVPVQRSFHMRLDRDIEVEHYSLPVESDMLILHSSYIGCPSIRDEIEGSWFIQTLCKKIDELSEKLDLESILTEVKREVAVDLHYDQYNRVTYEIDSYKQMPVITSTLIRKLYLKTNKVKTTLTDDALETYFSCPQRQRGSQSERSPSISVNGQCTCALNHFAYIKNCLSYFLDENPEDEVAQSYLDISNTFEDTTDFYAPKETMAKAICNHLRINATNHEYYKYIYMHKH